MSNRLYLIVALFIGFAVLGVVVVAMMGQHGPFAPLAGLMAKGPAEGAKNEFLGDLSNGKLDEAYQKTTAGFQQHMSADEFKELVVVYPALQKSRESNGTCVDFNSELAKFKGTLEGPNGSVDYIMLVSIKEGNGWKVDRFTVMPHHATLPK